MESKSTTHLKKCSLLLQPKHLKCFPILRLFGSDQRWYLCSISFVIFGCSALWWHHSQPALFVLGIFSVPFLSKSYHLQNSMNKHWVFWVLFVCGCLLNQLKVKVHPLFQLPSFFCMYFGATSLISFHILTYLYENINAMLLSCVVYEMYLPIDICQ